MTQENQQFDNFGQWETHASDWLTERGPDVRPILVDNVGRICTKGSGFMRARDQNTFPIKWYWPDEAENLVLKNNFGQFYIRRGENYKDQNETTYVIVEDFQTQKKFFLNQNKYLLFTGDKLNSMGFYLKKC